ncbi:hypothetical protein FKM82_022311 [Ascaphus truei]
MLYIEKYFHPVSSQSQCIKVLGSNFAPCALQYLVIGECQWEEEFHDTHIRMGCIQFFCLCLIFLLPVFRWEKFGKFQAV